MILFRSWHRQEMGRFAGWGGWEEWRGRRPIEIEGPDATDRPMTLEEVIEHFTNVVRQTPSISYQVIQIEDNVLGYKTTIEIPVTVTKG